MKYVRDLEHNYMVVKAAGETEKDYRLKMLLHNHTKGLLPMEVRNINGERYLYYATDRLQPLLSRFGANGMTLNDLKALMNDLLTVIGDLKELLLGEEGLMLGVNTIFTDVNATRYYFAYAPVAVTEEVQGFSRLTEELIDHVRTTDDEALDYLYELCDHATASDLPARDLLAKPKDETLQKETFQKAEPYEEIKTFAYRTYEAAPDAFLREEEEAAPGERKGRIVKTLSAFVLPVLFVAVLLSDVYIRTMFELTGKEKLLSAAVAVIALVCAAATASAAVRRLLLAKEEEEEDDEGYPSFGHTYDTAKKGLYTDRFFREETPAVQAPDPRVQSAPAAEDGVLQRREEEETRLLTSPLKARSPKLYGCDKDENIHIAMEHLPLTIGKQAGLADVLLKDDTVSRMHARIFRNAKDILMLKDLHSTNGTIINGRRLSPGEDRALKIGDEVCFGNMVFEYR